MTLQEKINSIIVDKTKDPIKTREFINKIEGLATTSEVKAMALIDGVIAKLTLDNPSAIKNVTVSTEQAKRNIGKLKTLKAIVPKKADIDKIEAQIKKQYPSWDSSKIRDLAQLRIDAQISRAESFNKMLETLEKSQFYGARELSTASIDKGRTRNLSKDASQRAITEKDEVKKYKRVSKRGAKNQYGTTKGGKVYYEYRMNRRDVDDKIRLATGGVLGQDVTYKYYDEERTGTITEELPNGYEVSSKWGTILVTPKEVISINAPKKKRFRFFKEGGGVGIPNADKMFHLPYEIAVYVPSTKDVDKTITATELRARVKEVEKYLAETFGGFTSSEKVGGYLSSKSAIITEKVVPVTAFSSLNDFTANKSKLINKMSVWAKKWGQEAIGFEFEGDLYYVPQKFKVGGTLKATYIPRRDIKMLTTVWGNNIRGKDLIDGAYTKRKNVKTAPKVARTQFEEETFEYAKGGGLNEATYIPRRDIKSLETVWGNNIRGKDLIDGAYTKRRNIKTAPKVARTQFEEETYEYAKGGKAGVPELNDLPKTNIYPKWVEVDKLVTDNKEYGMVSNLSNELLFERMIANPEQLMYREEYAIFDYENFPKALYSEGMGEAEFDKIITAYKLSSSMDIPMDVLASLMTEYSLNDANELEEFVNERYVGYFENNSDLGEHLVEMYGGVENMPKHTLEMYFDFDKYGRDEEINSLNDYEGYYFYNN